MGDGFAIAVASVLVMAFGILVGFHLGEEYGRRVDDTRGYALANVTCVLASSVLFAVVWATGYVVLATFAVGALAGSISGLKFGYGESVGPWKFVDRLTSPRGKGKASPGASKRKGRR